jgi:glutaredoxin-like protein NrdH
MKVTLYSKPDCQPCKATKRSLKKFNIEFTEESITDENRDLLRSLGHQQAPVITVENSDSELIASWSGYQPDLIECLLTK